MKRTFLFLSLLLVLSVGFSAYGSPLRLDYSVTDLGSGLFDYEFELVLDNNDDSWSAGQGWGWVIFGDASSAPSPLADFEGDTTDLPIGPYTGYNFSSGGHNGPTLVDVREYWIPLDIGDSLTWSGTSMNNLAGSELLFSTLRTLSGAVAANFQDATFVPPSPPGKVPEPGSMLLLGFGLVGLFGFTRRFIKR